MAMQKPFRRPIGRILMDAGILNPRNLDRALSEQKQTNGLIGQLLVKMGVIDQKDLNAALSVQEYLDKPEEAVKLAAGVRMMLGELLVQAGHITNSQLESALAEQKKTGEKLGEAMVRLGLIGQKQLEGILDFQRHQSPDRPTPGPLRLGEILASTGYITREQLSKALEKQAVTHKKLGEVLIDEGYAKPDHIKHGIRLQQMLMTAVLVAVLAACGGGGGSAGGGESQGGSGGSGDSAPAQEEKAFVNFFTVSADEFGLLAPNFYFSTDNSAFWSIQADIAKDAFDPDYKCIYRIDIQKTNGTMTEINKTFSIETNPNYEKFPGVFLVFNGRQSTNNKVEQGIVAFTPDSTASGIVKGTFDVIMTDYDSGNVPAPQYRLKGSFNIKMGTYGTM